MTPRIISANRSFYFWAPCQPLIQRSDRWRPGTEGFAAFRGSGGREYTSGMGGFTSREGDPTFHLKSVNLANLVSLRCCTLSNYLLQPWISLGSFLSDLSMWELAGVTRRCKRDDGPFDCWVCKGSVQWGPGLLGWCFHHSARSQ